MTRPSTIKELRFDSARLSRVGVEAMTLEELKARASATLLSATQRVEFHQLLLVRAGRAKHMVDFTEVDLQPGSVLLVRPGQVQQWKLRKGLQGELALISAEALAPRVARADVDMGLLSLPEWPAVSTPSQGLFMEAVADILRLRADTERFEGADVEAAIIRHELLTLLLRLARELRSTQAGSADTREAAIHRLFAQELERNFARRLSVLDYAKRLGYSESTLSRAAVATVGRTAKEEIDNRTALEARRLLAHSEATAAQIGHQLGFTEPTNFLKFFKRTAGCTPMQFREAHRG